MKKSTIKKMQQTTTNEATFQNLQRLGGKQAARQINRFEDNESSRRDYLAHVIAQVKKQLKADFENRQYIAVNLKATRAEINALTLSDVETATSGNGVINYRTLVNKCIGRVTTKERAEQRRAERKAEREQQAAAEQRATTKAAQAGASEADVLALYAA